MSKLEEDRNQEGPDQVHSKGSANKTREISQPEQERHRQHWCGKRLTKVRIWSLESQQFKMGVDKIKISAPLFKKDKKKGFPEF